MEFQVFLPFSFYLFTFLSAFLRGHYPEQVHRVISQLQAEHDHPLPWLIKFIRMDFSLLWQPAQDFFRFYRETPYLLIDISYFLAYHININHNLEGRLKLCQVKDLRIFICIVSIRCWMAL